MKVIMLITIPYFFLIRIARVLLVGLLTCIGMLLVICEYAQDESNTAESVGWMMR